MSFWKFIDMDKELSADSLLDMHDVCVPAWGTQAFCIFCRKVNFNYTCTKVPIHCAAGEECGGLGGNIQPY